MTPAERKARHDARKRAAGLVPVLLWTRPENKMPLRELAKLEPMQLLEQIEYGNSRPDEYDRLYREEIRKGIYEKHPDDVPFPRGVRKTQETDK